MTTANGPSPAALTVASPRAATGARRHLMAIALVMVLIAAIVGVSVTLSMGLTVPAMGIALIGGGIFCAAALC